MKSILTFFASLVKTSIGYIALIFLLSLSTLIANGGSFTSITKFPDPNFCTNAYPTSYSAGSFSIAEKKINGSFGFAGGQTNVTLIFGLSNSIFEFNTGVGTVTATGTEVTISSFVITSSTITVTLSTAATNVEYNTLNFNNIQIRANAVGTGNLIRTGGTFIIDKKTSNPKSSTPLGTLTSNTQNIVSSNTASQTVISSVYSGSSNNQIIGIQLVLTGSCGTVSVSSFSFNTSGSTNPGTDISSAKLFYTGTSNKFATTTLFGSTSSPNGTFSITGTQALGAGTYYFWLSYDINNNATGGNIVDAQYVSTIIAGSIYNATSGNPTGSRKITSNNYYSIATGNWSSTSIWTQSFGSTTSCNCAPTGGSGFVYVNHVVSLDNTYTVDNVTVQSGGNLTNTSGKKLTINNILATNGTGVFAISSAWSLNDVDLEGTGSSSSSNTLTINGNLFIGSGTIFSLTGTSSGDLTLNGDIVINGGLNINTRNLTISGSGGTLVSGTGTVYGSGTFNFGGNRTINTGSILTIAPSIVLGNNVNIINSGTVISQSTVNGSNNNSTWINSTNSVLEMGGSSTGNVLLVKGILDATSNTPNTVKFTSTSSQNIPKFTYDILSCEGTANVGKVLANSIIVNNKIQILNANYLDVSASNYSITLNGDWVNNGTSSTSFNARSGTVNFNYNCSIGGTAQNVFNNIYITSNGSLVGHPTSDKFYVTGNWTNDGDYDGNSSNVTFSGSSSSSILGASVTEFNSVNVIAAKPLTMHPTETDFDGNFVMNGVLTDNGLSVFSGDNAQSISGTNITLNNVTIDNTSGVTLNNAVTIKGVLTLTSGALISNGNLTINLNTGAIDGSGAGSTVGNITVKKDVNSGSFHYLSSPLNNLTVADWTDNLAMNNNYYYYNEPAHAYSSQGMAGWTLITNPSTSITPLQGYALNFPSNTTVDATGTYTHGASPANLSLSCTAPHSLGIDGWNLVGNPYPSTIDWDATSGWTKTNILNGIYFWDAANYRYVSYVGGVSSPSRTASNLIAPMQGFYVRVDTTQTTGTLGVTNAVRVTSSVPSLWRVASQNNLLSLTLSCNGYEDETVIRISDQATDYFDGNLDAYKLSNGGNTPNFYSTLNGNGYSINSFPLLNVEKIIPLSMYLQFAGNYTIEAPEVGDFDNSISCILEDKKTNTLQDLRTASRYSFNADTAGGYYNRFYIHLKTQATTGVNPANTMIDQSVNVYSTSNTINILFNNFSSGNANIVVIDRLGREVRKVDNANISSGTYTMNLPGNEGIYVVKILAGDNLYTSKIHLGQ